MCFADGSPSGFTQISIFLFGLALSMIARLKQGEKDIVQLALDLVIRKRRDEQAENARRRKRYGPLVIAKETQTQKARPKKRRRPAP